MNHIFGKLTNFEPFLCPPWWFRGYEASQMLKMVTCLDIPIYAIYLMTHRWGCRGGINIALGLLHQNVDMPKRLDSFYGSGCLEVSEQRRNNHESPRNFDDVPIKKLPFTEFSHQDVPIFFRLLSPSNLHFSGFSMVFPWFFRQPPRHSPP